MVKARPEVPGAIRNYQIAALFHGGVCGAEICGAGVPDSSAGAVDEAKGAGREELERPTGIDGSAVSGGPDDGGPAGVDDGGREGRRGGGWLDGEKAEGEGGARRGGPCLAGVGGGEGGAWGDGGGGADENG